MPIELTASQAETIAQLASELGGEVSVHQLADGRDVYLAAAGESNRYLVAPDGDVAELPDE